VENVDIAGGTVEQGQQLVMMYGSANRDPRVFDDPERFDLARSHNPHVAFGFGTHFCLGAHLARTELDISLRVLLSRLPRMRLAETDGVRITGTIHHLLRGPNRLPVRTD
jgi:cytochrome P450